MSCRVRNVEAWRGDADDDDGWVELECIGGPADGLRRSGRQDSDYLWLFQWKEPPPGLTCWAYRIDHAAGVAHYVCKQEKP